MMLTEQRFEKILSQIEQKGTVTVQELKDSLRVSESTIRRDLNILHDNGRLIKVFGGAIAPNSQIHTKDRAVSDRAETNKEEKIRIARYAASLIRTDDFVYLDAGTTTGYMIDYMEEKQTAYVTDSVSHAKRLAARGFKVTLLGGEMKAPTEAVVGSMAILMLQKYHFTIGFWGTDGVSQKSGFTTPDCDEAAVKQISMEQTKKKYVLCDHDKFNRVSTVSFGAFSSATVITDCAHGEEYRSLKNVVEVS